MHCLSAIIVDTVSIPLELKQYSIKLTERVSMIPKTHAFCSSEHYGKISNFPRFAEIQTDYFGGCGEQYASVKLGRSMKTCSSINEALRLIGIEAKDGMDEFDTIGLGQYRSTEEVL